RAARPAGPARRGRATRRHRVSLRRGSDREARVPGMERPVRLPAAPAGVYLPRPVAGGDAHPEGHRRRRRRGGGEVPRRKRELARMAKRGVAAPGPAPSRPRGGPSRPSWGPRIVAVLFGFVVLAVGVTLRRVYGFGQAKQITELQQRREALISEQL